MIYFKIIEITYPKKLTVEEYNNLEPRNSFFLIATGVIFDKDEDGFFSINKFHTPKVQVIIKTTVMMKIIPYVIYSSDEWSFESTNWKSIIKSEYTIEKIKYYHLLPENFQMKISAKRMKYIYEYISVEWDKYNEDTHQIFLNQQELESLADKTTYYKFKELEKYADLLEFWNMSFIKGFKIQNLIIDGRSINKDPYQFLIKNQSTKFDVEGVIRLFTVNPLNWEVVEKMPFIMLLLVLFLIIISTNHRVILIIVKK